MISSCRYYDPGNNVNHQITPGATSTTTSATTTPTTATTATTSTTATTTQTTPTGTGAVQPTSPPSILLENVPFESPATAPSGCGNFNGLDNCASGSTYTLPNSAERRRWQTPPKGDPAYVSTFQDMRDLVGYADIQYNAGRNAAAVVVNAASRTGETLQYIFNSVAQSSNIYQVNSGFSSSLTIAVTSASGKRLNLEPLNFIWQNNPINPPSGASFNGGQKGGIAEMFGWPYNDIAKECTFLGKAGYMGVKIWPPTEHMWGSHYYEVCD